MKYFCYLLVTFLLTGNNLSAQVYAGIKTGGGVATEKWKDADPYPARAVWYGGLLVHIDINDKFFFQPELLYSLRGYHRNADAGGNVAATVGYGYLSVPLLAGYKPVKNLSIMLGPEAGYMLFARSHFSGTTNNFTENINYRFSIDATAGAALAVTQKLAIEARMVLGITPLYRGIKTDQFGGNEEIIRSGRNRVLQVGLTYRLN